MSFDTVIRNGIVVDGTGLAPFRADVGIVDGRIARIGRIKERGATDIDAEGHVVTPGFIDAPHAHGRAGVLGRARHELVLARRHHRRHGPLRLHARARRATTPTSSSCATSSAPRTSRPPRSPRGSSGRWTDFAGYLDAIDRLPKGINYAANIGHSALRTYVMGARAFEEQATDDDLAAMRARARPRHAGRRVRVHDVADGAPPDLRRQARRFARLASWDEVCALVDVLAELGAGIFQMVTDRAVPDGDPDRMLADLALTTGVPVATTGMNDHALVVPRRHDRQGASDVGCDPSARHRRLLVVPLAAALRPPPRVAGAAHPARRGATAPTRRPGRRRPAREDRRRGSVRRGVRRRGPPAGVRPDAGVLLAVAAAPDGRGRRPPSGVCTPSRR